MASIWNWLVTRWNWPGAAAIAVHAVIIVDMKHMLRLHWR